MATSRTIFAGLLAAGLAVALGCGSKPEPTQAPAPPDTTTLAPGMQPPAQPPTPPPPPTKDEPKVAHEVDQTKQVVPAHPVRGSIAGVEVAPTVVIQGDELAFNVFKAGKPEPDRSIRLKLAPMVLAGQPIPPVLNRTWKVKLDDNPGEGVPHVWMDVAGKQPFFSASGYALTLELGALKDRKVPGKIYLSMLDEQKTVLAGTFAADYTRTATEWPTPDDAPYIRGEITVAGAKPDDKVRIAYAGFVGDKIETDELQGPFDPSPLELAGWQRNEADKSRLVFGDGKARPFRYEHVKLPPGRYLLSAAVVGGPVVWKWVNLPAGGTLTENLTLDVAKAGSVQVSVPAGVVGKVFVAPAEEPGKPPLGADLFQVVSAQVVRQDVDIVGGKAIVKNLGPGKYEVRVGALTGTVEVTAGKTAELVLK